MNGFMRLALLPVALLGLAACGGGGSSGGAAAATTFDLTGALSGLSSSTTLMANDMSALDYAKYYAAVGVNKVKTYGGSGRGDNQNSLSSNQCADGSFYRVLCTSWSVPPVAAYGDVACGGASSGSFTVSGLPLNTELSCFIRKSSDGSSFKPFKTIELPAASSMSGATDTISSNGNMALNMAVGSGGSLTVTVTSGDNKADDSIGSTTSDSSSLSGFYVITCDAAGNTTEQNNLCKCFMNDGGDKDACIANGASGAGDVRMPVDINIYTGAVVGNHDFNGDSTYDLTDGQTIQGVTVWGASGDCTSTSNCTSGRGSGGEGATHFSLISFTGSNASTASTAVAWASGSGYSCGSGCSFTIGAVPANNASQSAWYSWLTAMVDSAQSGGWVCNRWDGSHSSGLSGKASCIGNFVWQVYESLTRQNRLPRIGFDSCVSGACTDTPAAAMMKVDGIKFTSGVAGTDSPGAQPGMQYVFEQWKPLANGAGGTFSQSHEDRRYIGCKTGSGTDSNQGIYGCPSGASGVECFGREEMSMKFLPTSTANVYNMGFSNSKAYNFGLIRGGSHDGHSSDGLTFDAAAKCASVYGATDSFFVAKGTKL